MNLLNPNDTNVFFYNLGYKTIRSHKIMDTPKNNQTVFITAGIQPSIEEYEESKNLEPQQLFVMQPVLRTQYANSTEEGYSIAFINPTTAGFNISYEDYRKDLEIWMNYFELIGLDSSRITIEERDYKSTIWGNFTLCGKSRFYYYNKIGTGKIEIGDSTYYDTVEKNDGSENTIHSLSDTGFGLERLRWCLGDKSYYDLFSDSRDLSPKIKAFISAIGLITINGIKPSNKGAGYRARIYSNELAEMNRGENLNTYEKRYLVECIKYWCDFQDIDLTKETRDEFIRSISKEYERSGNIYIRSKLTEEEQKLVRRADVNSPRSDYINKLASAGIIIDFEDCKRR